MIDPSWPGFAERCAALVLRVAALPFALAFGLVVACLRHWFVFLLFALNGGLIGLAMVMSEPPVYEARALLRLATDEGSLEEQVALLRSESVARLAVERLGWSMVMDQEEDPHYLERLGWIERLGAKAGSFISEVEGIFGDRSGEASPTEKGVAAFRKISSISVGQAGGEAALVTLGVRGLKREGLDHQVSTWISAYRDRLEGIAKDSWISLLEDRIRYWEYSERNALEELEKARLDRAGRTSPSGGYDPFLVSLEDDHRRARERLRKYRDLRDEKVEEIEMMKTAGVQVLDPPSISRVEDPPVFPRIALAAGICTGIGALLAILLEALRIRRAKRKARREREAAERAAAASRSAPGPQRAAMS